MVKFYAYNKSFSKGYNIYLLEFEPGHFRDRKETFHKNVKTNQEASEIVRELNGCKD